MGLSNFSKSVKIKMQYGIQVGDDTKPYRMQWLGISTPKEEKTTSVIYTSKPYKRFPVYSCNSVILPTYSLQASMAVG